MRDLVDFGNDTIDCLTNWFAPLLQKSGCQVSVIPEEWLSLKVLVNTSFRDKDYASLWGIMLTKVPYKDDFKNVLHLVEIMLVLPISAAQCEHAVSAQNRIKSNLRVSLDHLHYRVLSESQPRVHQFQNLTLLISGLQGTGMQGKERGNHNFTDVDILFLVAIAVTVVKHVGYLLYLTVNL